MSTLSSLLDELDAETLTNEQKAEVIENSEWLLSLLEGTRVYGYNAGWSAGYSEKFEQTVKRQNGW